MGIYNYLLYIIFFGLSYICISKEVDDVFSDKQNKDSPMKNFGDGYSKFAYPYKLDKKDTYTDKLEKIKKLSKASGELPKWRRSLLISIMITVVISIVIYKQIPEFSRFFLYIIIVFFMVNFSFNYYFYHFDKHAENYIEEHLKSLFKTPVKII